MNDSEEVKGVVMAESGNFKRQKQAKLWLNCTKKGCLQLSLTLYRSIPFCFLKHFHYSMLPGQTLPV